jgi:hypothetical protein
VIHCLDVGGMVEALLFISLARPSYCFEEDGKSRETDQDVLKRANRSFSTARKYWFDLCTLYSVHFVGTEERRNG